MSKRQAQAKIVAGSLAAMVFALGVPSLAAADALSVEVRASVLRIAQISAVRAPETIVLDQADVQRGYVELAQPVEIDVRTNDRLGVTLGFSIDHPSVRAATLLAADRAVALGEGPALLFVARTVPPGLRVQTVLLRARLELSPQAVPGLLPWPLSIYLAPR